MDPDTLLGCALIAGAVAFNTVLIVYSRRNIAALARQHEEATTVPQAKEPSSER